ncbi:MAG: PTS system mannose/fructose/N-acetylgalactosamine-transporter subunit IIB [Clostridium sp.]
MGIINIRIDERLIHGQVASRWTSTLNPHRIIVANETAASSQMEKATLRMATPATVKLSVITPKSAAENIGNGKYGDQRLFMIFKNPKDVLEFTEAGGRIETLNVGNMSYKNNTKEVTKSIHVSNEEKNIFNELHSKGINIIAQLVPGDPVIDFMKKLNL